MNSSTLKIPVRASKGVVDVLGGAFESSPQNT